MLLKKAAAVAKGSGEPNRDKVAKVTRAQVEEIAETKMPDLNAATIEAAMRIIDGHRPFDGHRGRRQEA